MPIEISAPPVAESSASMQKLRLPAPIVRAGICLCLAAIAILVHGYHPFAVDGSIYVPAIKKQLNPGLYPKDAEFFLFPAQLSIFATMVAKSVRVTRLPLEYLLLLWHMLTISLFFAACWRLCRLCFARSWEAFHGILLMGA